MMQKMETAQQVRNFEQEQNPDLAQTATIHALG